MRRPGRIPEHPAAVTGLIEPAAVGQDEATFSEELGWTGFAIPQLSQRYSVIATGFIVGLLWGRVALPPLRRKRPVGFLSGRAALFVVATLQGAHGAATTWRIK